MLPLNVAHEVLLDLKNNWTERNSFQEPSCYFTCKLSAKKWKASVCDGHRHCEVDGNW